MRPLFLILFSLVASVSTAKTTLKISTIYPPGTEAVTSLQAVAAQLKEQTEGEVTLKVYPGGVMGDDKTVMRKIKIGQLHGAMISGTGLELITHDLKDISKPFQFDSLTQVYETRKTMDQAFRQRLQALKWTAFGPLDGGFSYLMSKKPLPDLQAVRNAKLWLPNTSDIQQMSRQLNVNYLAMNIGDVLTGLDTGAVDTLISPPSAAITLNWHSRFNYFTETPVIYTWGMLVLPERVIKRIPEEYRNTTQTLLTEWSIELDQKLRAGNENAFSAIQQLLDPQPFSTQDIEQLRLTQK